ncbi:hypothetical protein BDB00DRAFT_931799 [Zychaea mexicana]|uniref:uncharacterized protein n=1 Tax=Zychaea mexicana TaxID=64656 RepID=UPI0022FECD8F|nr:uncharacterized protein BDB00DRAFT_931799 [Zychaea mexicana]KAI9489688.1 hypothetical protein BDB00DRAFT_931799 [Zychaea mexicana]
MEDGSDIDVRQISGQGAKSNYFARFEHRQIRPGEHECCPYDSYDCSDKPDKNSIVSFWSHHSNEKFSDYGVEIKCPAGGFVIFHGTMKAPRFSVFYDNGAPLQNHIGYRYVNLRKSRKMQTSRVKKGQEAKKKEAIGDDTVADRKKHAKDSGTAASTIDAGDKNSNNDVENATITVSNRENKSKSKDNGVDKQQNNEET